MASKGSEIMDKCRHCGGEITGPKQKKYCTTQCRNKAGYLRRKHWFEKYRRENRDKIRAKNHAYRQKNTARIYCVECETEEVHGLRKLPCDHCFAKMLECHTQKSIAEKYGASRQAVSMAARAHKAKRG